METITRTMHGQGYEVAGLKAGVTYTMLRRGSTVVMSNTPMEMNTNYQIRMHAFGDVLIGGLGMGMILLDASQHANVKSIVIVEKELDVIDLVWPHLQKHTKCPIVLLHDDIFTAKEHILQRFTRPIFETIYFDIWDDITPDNWEEMKKLKRIYRSLLSKQEKAWMMCWREDKTRSMKYEENRDIRLHNTLRRIGAAALGSSNP